MTTETSLIDRTADWLLDHDGDLYGDEQERLRWYEGIAVAASIQWIAIPWVAAVTLFVGGRPVAPAVLALVLALYLPMFVSVQYVQHRRVRISVSDWSRKRVVLTVLAIVPYVLLVAGFALAFGLPDDVLIGMALGAVAGALVAFALARRRRRRELERETAPEDLE